MARTSRLPTRTLPVLYTCLFLVRVPSPRSDDRRDSSVASRREVFLTSSLGQRKMFEGTRKPVGWQSGCAECALLKLSGITGLMPSGREAPCKWMPLSQPIGSPRRLWCTRRSRSCGQPHDRSFRFELRPPDRTKEIDFQFDRSERFLRRRRSSFMSRRWPGWEYLRSIGARRVVSGASTCHLCSRRRQDGRTDNSPSLSAPCRAARDQVIKW
jgi:hypothetical protein